jgi:hypothetical protein
MMLNNLVRRRPLQVSNCSDHSSAVLRCQHARAIRTVANYKFGPVR